MKPSNDREAISLIIDGLIEREVTPTVCRDGENEDLNYSDKDEAIAHLMSCDESVLFVDLPDGKRGYLYFVLGNSPEEVVCDHTVNLSPYLDPIVDPWWE